jgi:hypothetical protein
LPGRVLFGIEEEVFITEPRRPTLQSLYYLARLLWRNPRYYYVHTASNFARGSDIRQGLMSGIELSTRPHASADAAVDDLARRRQELASVCQGLLVPLGNLFDYAAPTNTCGLHVHVGPVPDPDRAYANLGHFLPLFLLLTANGPVAGGREFEGLSYRMARSYAIGPLRPDPWYRFQDLIFARRLGTVEIRALDPVWDLERLRVLLRCVEALVHLPHRLPFDRDTYNRERERVLRHGYQEGARRLYRELSSICPVAEEWFARPPAEEVRVLWRRHGTLGAYSALDNAYRTGQLVPRELPAMESSVGKAAIGLAGYYMVRLPYTLHKVWQEW